jgi:hypothetical protein
MFKLSEKKQHRKRALLKLTACKPNCTNDDAENDGLDDAFLDEYAKVARKTVQSEVEYTFNQENGQMVEKKLRIQESYRGNSFDEVDNAQLVESFQLQTNGLSHTHREKVEYRNKSVELIIGILKVLLN